MGRRPFLRLACGGALTALSAGVLGPAYALMVEPAWLDIARCTVELPALPPALDGLTVAQLSDMHVTSPADANHLGRAVEVVQRLAPDLVALTGDYVTHDATHVALCAQALAPLQAPLGVYAVLGNHDVWTDADHVATGLAEVGITVLRDAAVPLDAAGARLWIVGVDDVGRTNRPGARCNAFAGVWERALARGSALLDELRDPVDRRPDQGKIRSDQGYLSSVCMRNRIDCGPPKVQCKHHICLHNRWIRLS